MYHFDGTTFTDPSMTLGENRLTASSNQISYGGPLLIEIAAVYTGEFPHRSIFGGSSDMLITSACKGLGSAVPRAINWICDNEVNRNSSYPVIPPANVNGTNVVYAKQALDSSTLTVTVELSFDDFNKNVTDEISKFLNMAATVPPLLPYAPYILVGSFLVGLTGKLGERILDSEPESVMSGRLKVGDPIGWYIICEHDFYYEMKNKYNINKDGFLVHKNNPNDTYSGDEPYVTLSLSNEPLNEDMKGFNVNLLAAKEASRFLNLESSDDPVSAANFIEAIKVYNDFKALKKIQGLRKKLKDTNTSTEDREQIQKEIDAMLKNLIVLSDTNG